MNVTVSALDELNGKFGIENFYSSGDYLSD
jgi:hypothetical protein